VKRVALQFWMVLVNIPVSACGAPRLFNIEPDC